MAAVHESQQLEEHLEDERQFVDAEFERLIAYLADLAQEKTLSTIEEDIAEELVGNDDDIISNDVYDEYNPAEAYDDYNFTYPEYNYYHDDDGEDYYDGTDGYDN